MIICRLDGAKAFQLFCLSHQSIPNLHSTVNIIPCIPLVIIFVFNPRNINPDTPSFCRTCCTIAVSTLRSIEALSAHSNDLWIGHGRRCCLSCGLDDANGIGTRVRYEGTGESQDGTTHKLLRKFVVLWKISIQVIVLHHTLHT